MSQYNKQREQDMSPAVEKASEANAAVAKELEELASKDMVLGLAHIN